MDKKRRHVSKRILNLTLEIIYLLTGEDYVPLRTSSDHVKPLPSRGCSKGQSLIMEPLPPSMTLENINDKKILQLTSKIIELLTGEDLECLEEDISFYADVKGEKAQMIQLSDGSSNRKISERCPRPLYYRDSTEEPQEIPGKSIQISEEDLGDEKVEDMEEVKAVILTQIHTDPEAYVMDDDTCKEEEISPQIITGECENSPECLSISPCSFETDENVIQDAEGQSTDGSIFCKSDLFPVSEQTEYFPSPPDIMVPGRSGDQIYTCMECGESFLCKSHLQSHQKFHLGKKQYVCPECGKCFAYNSHLVRHSITHTGEKPYSCEDCGKCFTQKSYLTLHERCHTGEKPYSCAECGKCFARNASLCMHQRIHTGVKPFSCSDCGKSFSQKSYLLLHQTCHRENKPFSCPQCGKCFTTNTYLAKHQRTHTGDKSCL